MPAPLLVNMDWLERLVSNGTKIKLPVHKSYGLTHRKLKISQETFRISKVLIEAGHKVNTGSQHHFCTSAVNKH